MIRFLRRGESDDWRIPGYAEYFGGRPHIILQVQIPAARDAADGLYLRYGILVVDPDYHLIDTGDRTGRRPQEAVGRAPPRGSQIAR